MNIPHVLNEHFDGLCCKHLRISRLAQDCNQSLDVVTLKKPVKFTDFNTYSIDIPTTGVLLLINEFSIQLLTLERRSSYKSSFFLRLPLFSSLIDSFKQISSHRHFS
jgi:hypothetical protein